LLKGGLSAESLQLQLMHLPPGSVSVPGAHDVPHTGVFFSTGRQLQLPVFGHPLAAQHVEPETVDSVQAKSFGKGDSA
jgi:hypothetical protein